MTVEFRLLGPVEALVDGAPVALGGRKPRAVLAMLLLSRNTVVSTDRIVDGLWGDTPPDGAANAVQAYVSRLRGALHDRASDANGTQMLVTRAPGYVLRVDAGQLDLARFEALVEEARAADGNGGRPDASTLLRQAEELWRGEALEEFLEEPFALLDAPRLSEMRLAAVEDRLALDLELGRHGESVAELEHLVRRHPYRERLTELLMTALYRCGRQTDALAAYADLRQRLVDEMGLEPGPRLRQLQVAVLSQDAAVLGAPASAESPADPADVPASPRRRGVRAAAIAGVAGCIALAAGVGLIARGGVHTAPSVRPNSVAIVDARTGDVLSDVSLGAPPVGSPVITAGGAWVADPETDTLVRIDLLTGAVRRVGVGVQPSSLAAADGILWVGSAAAHTVVRYDPRRRSFASPVALPADVGVVGTPAANLAAAGGAVWVDAGGAAGVRRLDARTGAVTATAHGVQTGAIAAGEGAVWVAGAFFGASRVDKINLHTGRREGSIPISGGEIVGVAAGLGAVWVVTTNGAVWRIDPATAQLSRTIPVPKGASGIAVGDGSVWITNAARGTLTRIDPGTNEPGRPIRLGQRPTRVSVVGRRVLVALAAPAPSAAAGGGTVRVVLNGGIDSIDPARAFWATSWQVEYATGRPLLSYPDSAGAAGTRLVPDAAAAMPALSADGRTYTFTLRRGLRFSSGAPVTAESFRYAIERALDPAAGSQAGVFLGDIVGAPAYEAGRVAHISGIAAHGLTIAFTLRRPDPSFLARIAMPYFSPVPVGTPLRPAGEEAPIPSAGPFVVGTYRPHQRLVLRRNRYYSGPRRLGPETIDYALETTEPGPRAVREGRADYLADGLSGTDAKALVDRFGVARGLTSPLGHPEVVAAPEPAVAYLVVNTRRPPFTSALARRALGYAIDRSALAATFGSYGASPTDRYLAPAIEGFTADGHTFPLDGPDVSRARALLRRGGVRTPVTVPFFTCDDPACAARARLLRGELGRIGVRLQVHAFPRDEQIARDTSPRPAFALADEGYPFPFMDAAAGTFPISEAHLPLPAGLRSALRDAAPDVRARTLGRAFAHLAARQSPLTSYAVLNSLTLASGRLGCVVEQPVYGVDLTRLCIRS
jgi:DNA-binding SARP family transcriptional activator/ABC-type transport system substrate-binding protein